MRQKTVIAKLLKSVTEDYYKVRQVLQSASGITKCDRLLLQSASGITKCDSYYKVRRNKPDFCISFQHLWIPNSMCNIPHPPPKKRVKESTPRKIVPPKRTNSQVHLIS